MASRLRCVFLPILVSCVLLFSHSVHCDHDEEDSLLASLNAYRLSLNLTALTKNDNAECLADEVAEQFHKQPCTNATGSNTVPGTEPQFPNYPSMLSKCRLNVSNTRDGIVLPACVPHLEPTLVVTNFTKSLYSDYLNDTKFTGVGIGHEDDWIVVVLTTATPEGSFAPAQSNVDTGKATNAASFVAEIGDDFDDHDDRKDDSDDRNDDRDERDDHDDRNDKPDIDDDDILLNGINAHRVTLRVPALMKSESAECFADEFADRFQDQLCANTTGSITTPGPVPRVADYPAILFKCNLNVSDGIILSVCAQHSASNLALSSLKSSPAASSLDDDKFTGIGIGSEDDWKVVVLTAGGVDLAGYGTGNTPGAASGPNPFNARNAVDGINSINAAGFGPKTSLIGHFMILLAASVILL